MNTITSDIYITRCNSVCNVIFCTILIKSCFILFINYPYLCYIISTTLFLEWSSCEGKVLAILRNEKMIGCIDNSDMNADDTVMIVTDKTCFYSEMGGQSADSGTMKSLV